MNVLKKNNKGFSLVELLAVVVILGLLSTIGIGITATLVDKAKQNKIDTQKNTIKMSAQTYMQNNKNLVPKIIGESSIVKVKDLKDKNYLNEDIKNDYGESCMEKSYVRVYKLSNSEYTYTTFLYCGNEEVPPEEIVPSPIITAKFSDSTGEIKDEKLNNVSDAYLYIELNAATEEEIQEYKNMGTDVLIDGYAFKIFVAKNGTMQESYNSGSLSGGKEEKIIINKKLSDYVDVTDITEISLEVTAINTLGGITHSNTTIGEHGEVSSSQYEDTIPPKCVKPVSPYSENDWINKNEYNLTKDVRKLTVGCDDGTGSGCIRNYFTESWPNDIDTLGAEYVYIEVKDNAGNVSEKTEECKFRVNVDLKTPEATITAYSGKASTSNSTQSLSNKIQGNSILSKTIKVNDSSTSATIETVDYKNLTANLTSVKWMNNEEYPNGVIYKIELKDNIRLDKWTWKTNAGYINDTNSSNYKKVSSTNPEATSGDIPQDEEHGMNELHGSIKDTIYVRFYTEGMRYGIFTAYDKSGNKIEIEIKANLDRTAPPIPSNLKAYVYNKEREAGTSVSKTTYTFGNWINRYVRVQTAGGQDKDDLSNNVTLSGFWQFYYDARNNSNQRVGTSDYSTNSLGIGGYDFKGPAAQVDGKNKIKFMGCDKAGNCSEWGTYKDVWIDITVPICTVTKTITSGAESSYGWLGSGETARVTATCNDPTSTLASGCTNSSFYHNYNYQINTSTAGANGNGKAGSFSDAAGNTVNCTADKRIQIDYTYPTCTVSGGSSSWTNKSRTVTGTCSDTGGSGCAGNISHTYNYDISTSSGGAAGNGNGGSIRDKADNYTSCAANQTVKVDITPPYVTASPSPGVFKNNSGITVTATCHDSLSGLSGRFDVSFTSGFPSPLDGAYIGKCCVDNAGNEMCDTKGLYHIQYYSRDESCGVEQYNSCSHKDCGQYCAGNYELKNGKCYLETTTSPSTSCRNNYVNLGGTCYRVYDSAYCARHCGGSAGGLGQSSIGQCRSDGSQAICMKETSSPIVSCSKGTLSSDKSKCIITNTTSAINKTCRTKACGVDKYKECWHY